jgi:co-chaperonin GroES (HSP10)
MDILPVGNRILVKKNELETVTDGGLILKAPEGNGQNVWGTIIRLPAHTDNPFIQGLQVGGEVLYKQFTADKGLGESTESFLILDVEPENGARPGQVLAYKPPVLADNPFETNQKEHGGN